MEALLSNKRYRKIFFFCTILLLAALFIVRRWVLPTYDQTISTGLVHIAAEVIESFAATLLVTILVGAFIFFVTPTVMKTAKFEPIEPKDIGQLLGAAASESTLWIFRGGMGRFTKAKTLPAMAERARSSGVTRRLQLVLLDPQNVVACRTYADYRNSVASAKKEQWTAESVRNQILATILAAVRTATRDQMVEVKIYLLPVWSIFRIDFSDQYAIVTGEDPREPALRIDRGSSFYGFYERELHWAMKQSSLLRSTELRLSQASEIPAVLRDIGVEIDIAEKELASIWRLVEDEGHQYATK